jgi:putative hemolysin
MELPFGKYVIKTASTVDERRRAFRLRQLSFFGSSAASSLDINVYDAGADHLLVKSGDDVVGTYRLRCSKWVSSFFSETEFQLGEFLGEKGATYLELSRACTDTSRRQVAVILGLWRGIREYMKLVDATYLFGCTSVFTRDVIEATALYNHLKESGCLLDKCGVVPQDKHRIIMPEGVKANDALMPALLSAYLKMGARVYGEPAYDDVMGCMDFFSVLRVEEFTAT